MPTLSSAVGHGISHGYAPEPSKAADVNRAAMAISRRDQRPLLVHWADVQDAVYYPVLTGDTA